MLDGLNEAASEIHKEQVEKGFYDKERQIGTMLMLIVSELSEAMEADRKGRHAEDVFSVSTPEEFREKVKDTFEDELADAAIRILDLCGHLGIDIEKHIAKKLEYNKSREHMHGKAY